MTKLFYNKYRTVDGKHIAIREDVYINPLKEYKVGIFINCFEGTIYLKMFGTELSNLLKNHIKTEELELYEKRPTLINLNIHNDFIEGAGIEALYRLLSQDIDALKECLTTEK